MKILFIGNFSVTFSTESHHRWTYQKLGNTVISLQENETSTQDILNNIEGIDLLVWTHTHSFEIKEDPVSIKEVFTILKNKNIPSVGYHLDLWKGIERQADLDTDPYWNIEYFFTVDKLFVDDLKAKGIKAYYLPAGVLESECYLAEPDRKRFPHDIIFVGSRGYHKEWPYRPQLIDWLKATYGDRFGHYGGDGLGVVRGHDLNVLYASAKVVIGDTLCKGFDYPYYFSDRITESIGRGAFIIFPYIKGLEGLFKIADYDHDIDLNTELVTYEFNNFTALKAQINLFTSPIAENGRDIIRKNGFNRVKRDHTYTQRLQYLLETIKNDKVSVSDN